MLRFFCAIILFIFVNMQKGKLDKATAIKSILSDLKKGIDRATILHKISKKCTKDDSTLRRWFLAAEKEYKEFMKEAGPIIREKEIEALGQIAVSNIMSKLERQMLLSDIARGDKKIWKEINTMQGVVKVEAYDPAKYIDLLNKMDGSYMNDIEVDDEITEIKITRINGTRT